MKLQYDISFQVEASEAETKTLLTDVDELIEKKRLIAEWVFGEALRSALLTEAANNLKIKVSFVFSVK